MAPGEVSYNNTSAGAIRGFVKRYGTCTSDREQYTCYARLTVKGRNERITSDRSLPLKNKDGRLRTFYCAK